jgi:hypothetical protein
VDSEVLQTVRNEYSKLRNQLRQNTLSQGAGPTFVTYVVVPARYFAVLSNVLCKGIFPMYFAPRSNFSRLCSSS